MLSESKLKKKQNMQAKRCNNNMPFSLPIIYVERKQVEKKPKYSSKTLPQLTAIFASDYWCWAKASWEKTKICNQNFATIICHFRFLLCCWAKASWEKTKICKQYYATINYYFRFLLLILSKNKLSKNKISH